MIIFPIDVVSRVPLVGGFVERMLHVVASVTAVLQRTRCTSLIVYDVDTHFVAIAETVIVDTCHGHLFYLSGQNDGASVSSCDPFGPKVSSLHDASAPTSISIAKL